MTSQTPTMPRRSDFPNNFLWGAATASYQIEGAANEGGKGESIWDRFSHTLGKVQNDDNGDIACDHYHRWEEDVQLMKAMGLQTYRFSISWPRLLPEGQGRVNPGGLDFYSRLVDALLEAGIQPCATLYHWDLPQALEDLGGWTARSTAESFVEYAGQVSRCLGDRVSMWATLNEPYVSAVLGYKTGEHAPGHKNQAKMIAASHYLLLAHGLALPVIRQNSPAAKMGIVLNLSPQLPASDDEACRVAAYLQDGILNRWYLDPLAGRGYPQDVCAYYGDSMEYVRAADMKAIAAPIDFLGINYYFTTVIAAQPGNAAGVGVRPEGETTEMGWRIAPEGLYETLKRLHNQYPFPAYYVTENGAAFPDVVMEDGEVHDEKRTRYLQAHFAQAGRAIAEGVPLEGYYVWSLMDNFEWGYGYTKRFGLVWVDYKTQKRILKDSAHWYSHWLKDSAS